MIFVSSMLDELCPAVPPAEQDMREVGLPAVEGGAEPGVPQVVHSGAFPARVVHRFRFSAPRARVPAALRARTTDERRAVVVGVGHVVWVSRRRGCGCATGSTGCFMRCRCGSCRRRRTGRSRCVGGGCRWCRCSTSPPAAGARPVWPRRQSREGAAGNGGGTRAGEARGSWRAATRCPMGVSGSRRRARAEARAQ